MTGIFGILESSATQWYQDVAPTQEVFFFFFFFSLSHLIVYGEEWMAAKQTLGFTIGRHVEY